MDPATSGQPFPSTHWSVISRAGDIDPGVKREALGRVLTDYLPAFRAHLVQRKHFAIHDAEDILQGFVCDEIVAKDLIARAERERGRFRTFVLTALDRYVIRVRRHDSAAKRSPGTPLVYMDPDENLAEAVIDRTPASLPSEAFDAAWAREVVDRAIRRMREECAAAGSEQVWHVFQACALNPIFDATPPPRHEELARRLAFDSAQQVSNALVTGKRMFARVLRSIVGEYARDRSEADAELRDLWAALSRASRPEPRAQR